MSLLESQSKGCVNPTFDPAHKCIFALYLQGRICTMGTWARATRCFEIYVPLYPHFRRPCYFVPTQHLVPRYSTDLL